MDAIATENASLTRLLETVIDAVSFETPPRSLPSVPEDAVVASMINTSGPSFRARYRRY
jgi:hypothetical protein